MTTTRALLAAALLLSASAPAPAASPAVAPRAPLARAGFDEGGPALPSGWTVGEGGAARANVDGATKRSGAASLHLVNAAPASTRVEGPPVRLEVGKVYRLAGWIRTREAFSDPTGRYPTPVPAALTMASFPFTNHSPAVGATRDWTRVETLFVATAGEDRIRAHLGLNGTATGEAWFDDLELSEVADVTEMIPLETVRWSGPGFRYDEKGWIFVHVEGEPYARGFQYGTLLAEEIAEYARKLGIAESAKDPSEGWAHLRLLADSVFLRKYDEEYLTEMKGIADGAAKAGAKVDGRPVDLLDVVTLNSAVDIGQMPSALRTTPNALTGRSFLTAQDELAVPDRTHKCSSFVATGPATRDGRVVFGQIFMWSGYTGVHFNVIADVVPAKGHRLVFQTFPGGIHSGTDFYVNGAGIVIGETTVAQTPWDLEGTPQSNRIRKAAQYASSIDDVARILRERNNGMYANDWTIADVKTDEGAILLLGTHRSRLWRTKEEPAPFGTPGFLWANNNARDPEVRREYGVQPDGAPFDLVFSPWNRDVAFRKWYDEKKGKIDAIEAVDLWASSPINRPHACDGKVTTAEMAEKLVFWAHYGKVTLREKFPAAGNRRMPDLPGAIPHLTLGYTAFNPIWVVEKLKEAHAKAPAPAPKGSREAVEAKDVESAWKVDRDRLWRGTVGPKGDADAWLVSGGAAYWQMLHGLPDDPQKARESLADQLAALNARALYFAAREGDVAAKDARRAYDRYGLYQIPRIKGTFALHQLRLLLGSEAFLAAMDAAWSANAGKDLSTAEFVAALGKASGRDLAPFLSPWIERTGLPDPRPEVSVARAKGGYRVTLRVTQKGTPYRLLGSVAIESPGKRVLKPFDVSGAESTAVFTVPDRPTRVVFDAGNDVPVPGRSPYSFVTFTDDFSRTRIVHGTSRQIEASRTLALRLQTALADAFSEVLPPVVKDCEVTDAELSASDLVLLGGPEDNSLVARVLTKLPARLGKGAFRFAGRTQADPDDGLFLCVPSPWNPERVVWLFAGNSALELFRMTNAPSFSLPQWAVFHGDEVKAKGWLPVPGFEVETAAD